MKTLFMVLVLSFVAYGQDNTPIFPPINGQDNMLPSPLISSIRLDAITLTDLINYQKECYADSFPTLTHPYVEGQICITYDYECNDESHYTWVWRHKQPTFEGFIEFLKKEYGK